MAKEIGGLAIPGATKAATAHGLDNAERARRYVASVAESREDCALLLEALGLVPEGMVLAVATP